MVEPHYEVPHRLVEAYVPACHRSQFRLPNEQPLVNVQRERDSDATF